MALTVFGSGDFGGAYVLRMAVKRNIRVRFGQFMGGQQVAVSVGMYVYVGSAMGSDKALGRRLVRHVTRSGRASDYRIKQDIINVFGKGISPRGEKKLLWHIDYLLDRCEVDMTDILALRSSERLEGAIAQILMAEGEIVAKGLGASDIKGHTHLLKVDADLSWWENLKVRLANL